MRHIFTLILPLSFAKIFAGSIILRIIIYLNAKNAQMISAINAIPWRTQHALIAKLISALFWWMAHASVQTDTTSSQEDAHPALVLTLAVPHAPITLLADKQPSILHYSHQALATRRWISSFRVGLAWPAPCRTVLIVIILLPAWPALLGIPSTSSSAAIFALFWDAMNAWPTILTFAQLVIQLRDSS